MAVPINETVITEVVPALGPIVENIRAVVQSLQWLVGGIFGLYLILVFLRWKESREVAKLLREMRDDMKQLSKDIRTIAKKIEDSNDKIL